MVSRGIAAVARRRARERVIGFSAYVMPAFSLSIIWIIIDSFVRGVDGFGFNPELVPMLAGILGGLSAVFGEAFPAAVLADGPLAFSFAIGAVPLVVVQTIQTAHTWSQERSVGAVDLVSLGPVNPSGYLLGLLAADLAISSVQLLAVAGAGAAIAAFANVSIGSAFWLVLMSMVVFLVVSVGLAALLASLFSSTTATIVVYLGVLAAASMTEIWLSSAVALPSPAGLRALAETLGFISPVGGAVNLLRTPSAGRPFFLLAGLVAGGAYICLSCLILQRRRNKR